MIIIISLVFTALTILIAIYATNQTTTKANGHTLLGIALPHTALKNEKVIEITKKYTKNHTLNTVVFAILTLPMFLASAAPIAVTLYLLLWCTIFIYINQKIFLNHFHTLYNLKKTNNWWLGTHQLVTIDTEVSRLKNTFPIQKKYFLIPILITSITIFIIFFKTTDTTLWTFAFSGLLPLLSLLIIYFIYSKSRSVVYSDNSEINLQLNRMFKREWTTCCFTVATIQSVLFLATTIILLTAPNRSFDIAFFLIMSAQTFSMMFIIFRTHQKISTTRNKMRYLINEELYEDDDLCWAYFGGLFYYNPNDIRVVVEKRIGVGLALNMATIVGKVVMAILILMIVPLFLSIAYYALEELSGILG